MDPFLAANGQFAIRLDIPITAPVTLVLHFSYTMYQKDVGYHLTAYTAADGTQMLLGATHMQACTPNPPVTDPVGNSAPASRGHHLTACHAVDGTVDAAAASRLHACPLLSQAMSCWSPTPAPQRGGTLPDIQIFSHHDDSIWWAPHMLQAGLSPG